MKIAKLNVNTNNNNYPIVIGKNILKNFRKILKENSIIFDKCLIVIDKKAPKKIIKNIFLSLYQKKIIYLFNPSEINKNQKNVNKILEILLKNNFHRSDCVISVGGGITGDVVGFAASIFKRGIKFINVPTTLLAQVDSSIGGKTGINSKYGKNLIGSFYQPTLVLSEVNFLKSLPKREIICGYAEILKYSIILDKKFFIFLQKNGSKILNLNSPYIEKAIYKSSLIKKKVIELDENEISFRKILNLGHTFAHAFEGTMKFSKKINHGEAVLLGISCATKFSYENKLLSKNDYKSILEHLKKLNLPNNFKKYFSNKNINKIIYFMHKDKKNKNKKINLVLIKKIGKVAYNKYYESKKIKNFLKKF